MCYYDSEKCWGGEQVDVIDGAVTTVCMWHRTKKSPVVRIEIHDNLMSDYSEFCRFMDTFIERELDKVPYQMYGVGDGSLFADLYAWQHDVPLDPDKGEFTHIFIAWDFDDEKIFDRLDGFLGSGVVVNSVTL